MSDVLDDEMGRLSQPVPEPDATITLETLRKPIEKLLSKVAICVEEDDLLSKAVSLMREKEYGAICVTRKGRLVGIITERDLVTKVFGVLDDPLAAKARDVMTPDPICLQMGDRIIYACHNMHVGGYRHLPIVDDDDRPTSVVSIKDVTRYFLNFFQRDVSSVTGEPYRGPRTREGA